MKHSLLSASSSSRWLACTPSARLTEGLADTASEYAVEGTFAHQLADVRLSRAVANTRRPSEYQKAMNELEKNPLWSPEMRDYIEEYKDIVAERFLSAKEKCPDTLVLLEQKLDYSDWVQGGYGTGDVVIISDGLLEIIDLKYGKGVPVEAEGNTQMMLYALGAIATYGAIYPIELVRMTIVQPRLDSVSSQDMPAKELLDWAEIYVKPRAQLAYEGKGVFVPGKHCRFCKAGATCRARAEANLAAVKDGFKNPALLTVGAMADIVLAASEIKLWLKDVEEYCLLQAVNHGVKYPGLKIVEGRSNRVYTDIDKVVVKLKAEGYNDTVIYAPQEIRGITDMEKQLGKKLFATYLEGLVVKPTGKPTLVPESDKRLELNSAESAKTDFDKILN